MKRKISLTITSLWTLSALFLSCEKPAPEPEPEPEPEIQTIELTSPVEGETLALEEETSYSFLWKKVDGISNYKLCFSLSQDMSNPHIVPALVNPIAFTGKELDANMETLGLKPEEERTIYWSIIPFSTRDEADSQVRSLTVKRLTKTSMKGQPADTIIHKIGVYYEDMYVGDTGKRLHQLCGWADPHVQAKQLAQYMTECSHGVVQYKLAVEIDGTKPYASYYQDSKDGKHKKGEVVTADICYYEFFGKGYPGIGEGVSYDYSAMIVENGFDTMMNDKTIDEVWVYNHPGAGMYETCMAGPGAFWINGSVFDVPSLKRQCTVLFCNYERTVDLAMHSLCHKFENVMKRVYDETWSYNASLEKNLNNWERFSAYQLKYKKYQDGYAHIGNCHYPFNASDDNKHNYGYSNSDYVYTYADSWLTYPDVPLENARLANYKEWGKDQMGYMKWFYSHVPYFAGVNEADGHLNNWWYYFIDYEAAKSYERKLLSNIY